MTEYLTAISVEFVSALVRELILAPRDRRIILPRAMYLRVMQIVCGYPWHLTPDPDGAIKIVGRYIYSEDMPA